MKPLSLNAYAKHRGCSPNTVIVAVREGRLARSARRVGKRWVIPDAAAADLEWAATTQPKAPHTGPTAPRGGGAAAAGVDLPPDLPALAESRARREAAEAAMAEIELAEKRGELVAANEVEGRLVSVFSTCKTKLLGVPSRARQQDPGLSAGQISTIDRLIREALEDLAVS